VEQDPSTWKEALIATLRETSEELTARGMQAAGISLTSQRASVIPVDSEGKPLRPAIMWQDKRSVPQCRSLLDKVGLGNVYRRTGLRIDPYFSLPKMLWLQEMQPQVYARASKLVGVQDYVAHCLTGRFVTDWTQASRTMLMDIHTRTWDTSLLEAARIEPSKLCELCPPGTVIGSLTRQLSRLVGLPSGTPVILAGGDQQCAALGMNIVNPGQAEVTTGTGSFVLAHCQRPLLDPAMRTLCSCAAVPSAWICEAPILTTGAVYQWLAKQLYPEVEEEGVYEVMAREASGSPVGAKGLLLLPHFEGSAAPNWSPVARGLLFNLSLGTTRGDIARATLEGICLEIAHCLMVLEEVVGSIHVLKSAGGLHRVPLFARILADSTGKSIHAYSNPDASTLGATLSCAVSLNIYADHGEALAAAGSGEVKVIAPHDLRVEQYRRLLHQRSRLFEVLRQHIYEDNGREKEIAPEE
jgi:xylulokinase/glycerol kinase